MSKFRLIVLFLVVAFCLAGCAAPPLIGGSGAASTQETDGKTATMEPMIALAQPGAFGGATNAKLAYERLDTGTQSAPSLTLNLQPPAGSTVAASYPSLTSISPFFIVVMGNAQRGESLSAEQIAALEKVAEKAGTAAVGILDASGTKAAAAVGSAIGVPAGTGK